MTLILTQVFIVKVLNIYSIIAKLFDVEGILVLLVIYLNARTNQFRITCRLSSARFDFNFVLNSYFRDHFVMNQYISYISSKHMIWEREYLHIFSNRNKSYDDSVKLKRTEMV